MKKLQNLTTLRAALLMLPYLFLLIACTPEPEPEPCGQIGVASGNQQTGDPGNELAQPLVARVTGKDGQPLQGVSISWEVASGGGSLSANSSTTDANGQAEVRWTLGITGSNQMAQARLGASQKACSSSTSVGFQALMNNPVVTITNATTKLESLNSCDNGGSLFRHTLSYTSNINLENYFVEILSESVFSNGDVSNIIEQASQVEATQIKIGNCTKFGGTSYIDRFFTIRVYAKDASGSKTGPMLAESNKSNKIRNVKPENGARVALQPGVEHEKAVNSLGH